MRPERDNIAAPDLPRESPGSARSRARCRSLTAAGPALVHFIDFAQLNSVRTLPYLAEWDAPLPRRRPAHDRRPGAPLPVRRRPRRGRRRAASGSASSFPVAIDAERALWHAYGCEGWPSLFLWSRAARCAGIHFGEGEYAATEEAIQAELRELDALRELPAPLEPLRPDRRAGARVMPPSPELFPGGSWERPWSAGEDGDGARARPTRRAAPSRPSRARASVAVELDGEAVASRSRSTAPALHAAGRASAPREPHG